LPSRQVGRGKGPFLMLRTVYARAKLTR